MLLPLNQSFTRLLFYPFTCLPVHLFTRKLIHSYTHIPICSYTLILIHLVFLTGCQQGGYSTDSIYRTDIKTVFVPIFESRSFRRQVEFELTGALTRQIELHTPYKVVSDRSQADTILSGRINATEKVLTQEPGLDRPLENQVVLSVQVIWKDRRSGDLLIDNQEFRVSGDYAALLSAGPESAVRQAANELALRIVERMEKPW